MGQREGIVLGTSIGVFVMMFLGLAQGLWGGYLRIILEGMAIAYIASHLVSR